MKILVLNSGSSSIKFQLMNTADRKVLCKGLVERIGLGDAIFNYEKAGCPKTREVRPIPDHTTGIKLILDALVHPECGVMTSLDEIAATGHRIVHGGEKIQHSVLLCDETLKLIERVHPPRAASQPGQPHGRPRHADPAAGHPQRRRLRHRLPRHHAQARLHVRRSSTRTTRSTASVGSASTAPPTSTWPLRGAEPSSASRRRSSTASPATWATACRSPR